MAIKLFIDPKGYVRNPYRSKQGVFSIGDAALNPEIPEMGWENRGFMFHSAYRYMRLREKQVHNVVLPALSQTQNTYPCNRVNVDSGIRVWAQTWSATTFQDLLRFTPPMVFCVISEEIIPGMVVIQTNGDSYRAIMTTSERGRANLHSFAIVGSSPLPSMPLKISVYYIEDPRL